MRPKVLGSVVALFVIALCFAVSYGQQRVQICEGSQCDIVELPQAKVDPPFGEQIIYQEVPAFPNEVRYVQSQRTTQTRSGLLQRVFRPLRGLRGLCCRR